MYKIWFILIEGKREGPFAYEDLKADCRLTPDTWVWKKGFDDWKKIRDVPELKKLFEDDDSKKVEEDGDETNLLGKKPAQSELVMDFGQEPPYFLWILIALISLLYLLIRLYGKN